MDRPGEFDQRAHPTLDDPVVAAVSDGIGGRLGRHAAPHRWWHPLRVLLAVTALVFALGMLQKAPCYADTWLDGEARYGQMCYSDLPYLYVGRGFVELGWPYADDAPTRARFEAMEYPVGISTFAWAAAWLTHAVHGFPDIEDRPGRPVSQLYDDPAVRSEIRGYVAVSAVLLGLAALVATWFLVRVHRDRPWDAALFAASPALLLTGLVNWDLLAVALVAAALWTWSRGRPAATGLLLGLGTATKLYPLFLLGGILVICLRERRWADLARASGAAGAAWVAANLPAYLTGPDTWRVFWTFNAERGADLGSLWLVARQAGLPLSADLVNAGSLAFFGVWCLAVLGVGLAAPQSPRLAQLGFLVVAGFLLANKVYSPQYVLWLLPLAALARPRWRDHLVWQGSEVLYFAAVWWYLGGFLDPGSGDQAGFYWLAIVLRTIGLLWLVAVVVRDVVVPARDPVLADRLPLGAP